MNKTESNGVAFASKIIRGIDEWQSSEDFHHNLVKWREWSAEMVASVESDWCYVSFHANSLTVWINGDIWLISLHFIPSILSFSHSLSQQQDKYAC